VGSGVVRSEVRRRDALEFRVMRRAGDEDDTSCLDQVGLEQEDEECVVYMIDRKHQFDIVRRHADFVADLVSRIEYERRDRGKRFGEEGVNESSGVSGQVEFEIGNIGLAGEAVDLSSSFETGSSGDDQLQVRSSLGDLQCSLVAESG